ncbi:MAG: hypothetical protein ACK4GN_00880 [Runella sp.]
MNLTKAFAVMVVLATAACNSTTSTENSANNSTSIQANASSGHTDCLLSHANKGTLNQLLPLEVIKKYVAVPDQAQKKYDFRAEADRHDRDTYEYTWDSDRTQTLKIMGREITAPVSNRVGLSWVGSDLFMISGKPTPLENFKAFYRNMTAAEKEAAFEKVGERMKEKGYSDKETNLAKDMAKDLSSEKIMFKEVTGIGDAASWRVMEKQLTVLVGKITFQVGVDVSNNEEENIELAKKIATEVLAKCK